MEPRLLGSNAAVSRRGLIWKLRTDEGDGSNYDRLVTVKNKYDPTNFFKMNHNIKPTS